MHDDECIYDLYPLHTRLVLQASGPNRLTESLRSTTLEVVIEKYLSGHGYGYDSEKRSVVLLVRVVKPEQSGLPAFVAKVFDPNMNQNPMDPLTYPQGATQFCEAGREAEIAVYQRLESFQGTTIPLFYDDFRVHKQWDQYQTSMYPVSAILLGVIDLPSLADRDPDDYSPSERQAMETAVYALLDKFHELGVYHLDDNPPNWFWDRQQNTLKVIDFEDAICADNTSTYVRDTASPVWTAEDRGNMETMLNSSCGVPYKIPPDPSDFRIPVRSLG